VADWINYSQGGIVNVDGKCKPFDSHADGFGRGEGCVSVVLKPLDAALRDSDKIYGLIRGSAINSTGSLAPVSAPVASTQQAAMEAALRQARLSPQDVDFLELHATGTSRGDPTEANWVGPLFQRDGDILIGSVKGNIGYVDMSERSPALIISQPSRDCGLSRVPQQSSLYLRDRTHPADREPDHA
jgi:acyl transferase domain-containing protein